MGKSKKIATQRAWRLVRMALLWGRKGGIFKRWQIFDLPTLFSKHLKALNHHNSFNNDRYCYYGEKQLSFDETPIFNLKMHRPTSSMRFLLPCIAPPIEFDYDFEDDSEDVRYYDEECDVMVKDDIEEEEEEEEKGVDVRAEEFIANFYEQIKLQRQISYLQYKEHNDNV